MSIPKRIVQHFIMVMLIFLIVLIALNISLKIVSLTLAPVFFFYIRYHEHINTILVKCHQRLIVILKYFNKKKPKYIQTILSQPVFYLYWNTDTYNGNHVASMRLTLLIIQKVIFSNMRMLIYPYLDLLPKKIVVYITILNSSLCLKPDNFF